VIAYELHALFEAHCKATRQWGLLLSFDIEDQAGLRLACPYFEELTPQAQFDGHAFIFGTQEEIEERFWQTVGDDGPTKKNKYNGPVRVYAMTCDDTGQGMNVNT
jgi:hypothetical protein